MELMEQEQLTVLKRLLLLVACVGSLCSSRSYNLFYFLSFLFCVSMSAVLGILIGISRVAIILGAVVVVVVW